MARQYRRKRKKSNTGAWAVLLGLVLVIGLMGGFFIWLWMKSSDRAELDPETLCPVKGPKSVTVFLVDTTDPVSQTTLSDLKNEFRKAVAGIGPGAYLKIVSLTGTPGDVPTMFDGCNPGDGSTVDKWTSNPRRQQKQWEEAFGKPLETIPEDLQNGATATQSPIMAAIQKIKLSVFDTAFAGNAHKSLIIASDMIEHTDLYSQYRSGIGYDDFRESEASREYRTALKGVDVTILYIDRKSRRFGFKDHGDFWAEWVTRQEGGFRKLVRLEGLNP